MIESRVDHVGQVSFPISILKVLFDHLKIHFEKLSEIEKYNQDEYNEYMETHSVITKLIKENLDKLKIIKSKEIELNNELNLSSKLDDKIIKLNKILRRAINDLSANTNLFQIRSSNKNVIQTSFIPRHLINFSMRLNKSYSSQPGLGNFLPREALAPFPSEHEQMKASFLKFNFEESVRLKMPILSCESGIARKGSLLEIKYQGNDSDVFFRYTTSSDSIPTFFNGEIYNPNSPPILERAIPVLKIVSCKFGFMDSRIKTLSIDVTEEETQEEMIQRTGAKFNLGAVRPENIIMTQVQGYSGIHLSQVDLEEEDSSHYTPGSVYQVSLHRTESRTHENDDGF